MKIFCLVILSILAVLVAYEFNERSEVNQILHSKREALRKEVLTIMVDQLNSQVKLSEILSGLKMQRWCDGDRHLPQSILQMVSTNSTVAHSDLEYTFKRAILIRRALDDTGFRSASPEKKLESLPDLESKLEDAVDMEFHATTYLYEYLLKSAEDAGSFSELDTVASSVKRLAKPLFHVEQTVVQETTQTP